MAENKQPKKAVFDILCKIQEIQRTLEKLEYSAKLWKIPQKAVFDLNLVIEEILSLVIRFGKRIKVSKINITFFLHGDVLIILIRYPGIQFNPLEINTSAMIISKAEEEEVHGGLGMELMKNLVNSISYKRHEKLNEIIIQKKIFML